jgi:hypothetical protein
MPESLQEAHLKGSLNATDFTPQGAPSGDDSICTMVVETKRASEAYLVKEKWKAMWGDNNVLYNSPRALTMYNGMPVMEPDVQRFTMAQDENAITPQFIKGLFYSDPPFELRPGPGVSQRVTDAKRALMQHCLVSMQFQRECEWALEGMTHQGTCIIEWGVTFRKEKKYKRKSSVNAIPSGMGQTEKQYSGKQPEIEEEEITVVDYVFENVPLTEVFPDPKLNVPDVRESGAVVRERTIDFYGLQQLRLDPSYNVPEDEELKTWFMPAVLNSATQTQIAQLTVKNQVVNAGQVPSINDPNPLRKKIQMLTYVDVNNTYTVIAERHLIRNAKNPYGKVNYLSANYWNAPNALYGIGVGRLASSDQRLETGSVNTALKILAMKANAPYLRQGDANMPSQMMLTGLGRVLTVSDLAKAYEIMPTPDVPRDLFTVLADARAARQAATGADSMLIAGSSSSNGKMSTKATGAVNAVAGAAATRLDGPLDRFINQIFVPFLRILDDLIYRYMPDQQILNILGKKLGQDFLKEFDIDEYHDASCDFDVLAGAKLAARAGMAQALVILFQFFENPQLIQNLAELSDIQVDLMPLLRIAFHAYQFGAGIENDIFKPLPKEKKQQLQAQNSGQNKLRDQLTLSQEKFSQKQQLEDQANSGRITRDIVRDAFKKAGLGEAETGVPEGNFEEE